MGHVLQKIKGVIINKFHILKKIKKIKQTLSVCTYYHGIIATFPLMIFWSVKCNTGILPLGGITALFLPSHLLSRRSENNQASNLAGCSRWNSITLENGEWQLSGFAWLYGAGSWVCCDCERGVEDQDQDQDYQLLPRVLISPSSQTNRWSVSNPLYHDRQQTRLPDTAAWLVSSGTHLALFAPLGLLPLFGPLPTVFYMSHGFAGPRD